jgi:hypothetical protein
MLQIQRVYEERTSSEKYELEKAKDEIFLLTNKLQEKDSQIACLKKESEKNDSIKMEKKVYVCDPSRNNIDINNELNSTRDILAKISKMLNAEKVKNEKLNNELTVIKGNTVIMTPKCSCDREGRLI